MTDDRCRWNGSANPRTVPGRHEGDCNDEACRGCAPWESHPDLARIVAKMTVVPNGYLTPCWESGYAKNRDGYTLIKPHRTRVPKLVHRVVYELLVGPIAEGLTIDHLCRVRHCFNPEHLEPVTRRINTLRGIGFPAINAYATHCTNGHEFTEDNTILRTRKQGGRECRTCSKARRAKRRVA